MCKQTAFRSACGSFLGKVTKDASSQLQILNLKTHLQILLFAAGPSVIIHGECQALLAEQQGWHKKEEANPDTECQQDRAVDGHEWVLKELSVDPGIKKPT